MSHSDSRRSHSATAKSLGRRRSKFSCGGGQNTKRKKKTSTAAQLTTSKRRTRSSSKKTKLQEKLEAAQELFSEANELGIPLGRKRRGVARKERNVMSKRRRLTDTIYNIVSNPQKMQLVDWESIPVAKGKRRRNVSTPPKPPPPTRGRIIIDPSNNLNIVLKLLGLLRRKDGFEDARHKFTGWFLHGPNADDPRPGRRSHLTRQAFILAQLAFNAGNKNLPFSLTKLPKRRVKAQALIEAMGPAVRRARGTHGNIQRGGVIGATVPAGAIAAAKAGAVLAPILKASGISLLSGAGSVLGAKLTNKLLKQSEEEY